MGPDSLQFNTVCVLGRAVVKQLGCCGFDPAIWQRFLFFAVFRSHISTPKFLSNRTTQKRVRRADFRGRNFFPRLRHVCFEWMSEWPLRIDSKKKKDNLNRHKQQVSPCYLFTPHFTPRNHKTGLFYTLPPSSPHSTTSPGFTSHLCIMPLTNRGHTALINTIKRQKHISTIGTGLF